MVIIFIAILIIFLYPNSNSESETFTLDKTKLLKAILPFLILIHHLWIFDDFKQVGIYVVAMFFFISGYGLQCKRDKKQINFHALYISLQKLLIPLIIPSIVYILLLYYYKDYSITQILEKIKNYQIILPYTWFIVTLILLYILYYSLSTFIQTNYFFISTILIGILCIGFIAYKLKYPSTYYQANLAFVGGCLYKEIEQRYNGKMSIHKKIYKIPILTLLTFVTITCCIRISHFLLPIVMINSIIWTYCIAYIISSYSYKKQKWISFLSSISYELYICQGITFLIIDRENYNSYLLLLITLIINTIIAYLMHNTTNQIINIYDSFKTRITRVS